MHLDLLSLGLLPPMPAAFCGGNDLDLLEPLRFVSGDGMPDLADAHLDRSALAEALAVANASYGHVDAQGQAALLADPATQVVVTGQQPGLFGGPLYTLSKAVAAARWADRLRSVGIPAVSVFWVATEDHDFVESSRATFLVGGRPETVTLGEDTAPLMPVGMRVLGEGVTVALQQLRDASRSERFADWLDVVEQWYTPSARFGEAFSRLLCHLLGDRSPLLLDAMNPAVKEAEAPWMRTLVEQRGRLQAAVMDREERIGSRGYRLQVNPQPEASPLFLYQQGARRRIIWLEGGRWGLRGLPEFSAEPEELLSILDENPGVVSPGVLARPAMQDALLGTCMSILGPGELSYLPQAAPVYEVLGISPPSVSLRPQIMVLEEFQMTRMTELGVSLSDLVVPDLDIDSLVAHLLGDDFVAPAAEQIDATLEAMRPSAMSLDTNLDRPYERTRDQIRRSLEAFSNKVSGAVARRNEVATRRVEGLREVCCPGGKLQERVVCTAHYPGKYDLAFVDRLWEQMSLSPTEMQVITP